MIYRRRNNKSRAVTPERTDKRITAVIGDNFQRRRTVFYRLPFFCGVHFKRSSGKYYRKNKQNTGETYAENG